MLSLPTGDNALGRKADLTDFAETLTTQIGTMGNKSVNVTISDRNSRYYTQSRTLARDLAQELGRA
jgi:hypothetical protein